MNKSFKNAFTLVELIIVISIMTLITTSSVFYFVDFVKNKEITQKIKIIEEQFKELDKDIKNYEIYDYEITLNTNTLSGGYITYLNNFDINYRQKISLNTSSGSGTISISGLATLGTGLLKLYKKKKLFLTEETSNPLDVNFIFNTVESYKIISTLSGETLNDIHINYFTKDNLYPENNNNINLITINTKSDKSGTSYNNITIKNIGGTKIFLNSGTEISSKEIYLYFENNGIEKFIKITK